jgi:hypothetical protein
MTELTEWTTPELTVLVRNQPEEAVLQTCKDDNRTATTGPASGGSAANSFCRASANTTSNPCVNVVVS